MKALAIQPGSTWWFTLYAWQLGALRLVEKWKGLVSALGDLAASTLLNAIDYVMQSKAKFASLIINPAAASISNQTTTTFLLFPCLPFMEGDHAKPALSSSRPWNSLRALRYEKKFPPCFTAGENPNCLGDASAKCSHHCLTKWRRCWNLEHLCQKCSAKLPNNCLIKETFSFHSN